MWGRAPPTRPGRAKLGQTPRCNGTIPILKGLRGRNRHLGSSNHTGVAGKSGKGKTSSPRPTPKQVPPTRNSGKSDPTSAAIRNLSGRGSRFFRALSRASKAPQHSPKPHPAHPAPADDFSISITTRPRAPSAAMARSTIRQQVFESSLGTRESSDRISIPEPWSHRHPNNIMQTNDLIHSSQDHESHQAVKPQCTTRD